MSSGTITSSQFQTMSSSENAIQIVAPMPGFAIVVNSFILNLDYGTTPYENGGTMGLEYGISGGQPSSLLTGIPASTTNPASDVYVEGDTFLSFRGVAVSINDVIGQGVYLSNATGAFTNGDSGFDWSLSYDVVSS